MSEVRSELVGAATLRRIQRRLVWVIMLAALIAMMDRLNLSYAALGMMQDIGLTPSALGLGSSLFFIAFLFAEIPSNLIMWKVGARRWIARIMVSWGFVSGLMAVVQTPMHFYIVRFMLGVAEAGFLPGMLLYLSLWIPEAQRGRFNSYLLFSIPIAGALTAVVSGALLQLDGLWGLAGWRLVFLFEAVPAVLLGVFIFFYLQDRPADATWLSPDQKTWLQGVLSREAPVSVSHEGGWRAVAAIFRRPQILVLCLAYFALNTGVASLIWTPQVLQPTGLTVGRITLAAGLVNALAAVFMIVWAGQSDRRRERPGHFAIAMVLCCAGFVITGLGTGQLAASIVGLAAASSGAYAATAIFWTAPQAILAPHERPGGIAAISLIGITAGMISPIMVGHLREASGGYGSAMLIASAGAIVSAVAFWVAARMKSSPTGDVGATATSG